MGYIVIFSFLYVFLHIPAIHNVKLLYPVISVERNKTAPKGKYFFNGSFKKYY